MNLLICSAQAPYDSVNHAGGQIHNYYLKRLKKDTSINIHLISFFSYKSLYLLDLEKYNISNKILVLDSNEIFLDRIVRKVTNIIFKIYPKSSYWNLISNFGKYLLINELKKLKRNNYLPDIIELNWTEMVLLFPSIRKIFPYSKYYAVEQDVTFLRYEREYLLEKNPRMRLLKKNQYTTVKKAELNILNKLDKTFVLN